MEQEIVRVTKAGKQKLEEELRDLKENRRKEVVEQIKTARGFGDLSENSEYDEAKNEQGKVEARISELEAMLKNVVVVEDSDTKGKAHVGTTVKVYNVDRALESTYHIVGANEVDYLQNKISDQSPIGRALLGFGEGDEVEVLNADGKRITTLRILGVE